MERFAFRFTCSVCILILCGHAWPATLAAQSTDVVRLTDAAGGTSKRGTIKRMNKRNVTIEVNGTDQRVEANEIRFVTFANEPRVLQQARTNLLEGRDNRAYEDLLGIDVDSQSTDFVKLEIRFLIAATAVSLAVRGEGVSVDDARAKLDELLADSAFAENFHYYEVVRLRGDMAMAVGNYEEAAKRFEELASLPWPDTAMEAKLRLGQCLNGQEQYSQAITQFDEVSRSDLNDELAQSWKLMAKIGKAAALAGTGQAAQGIAMLEEIIQQQPSDDVELFAKLYTALGKCYLQANQPKYAKHQFLHVDLLYNQDADSHAEALYYLVDLWAQEGNAQNSNEARQTLQSRYPNSVWTAKLNE